jgi:Outer membrane protein beta-barrel domain
VKLRVVLSAAVLGICCASFAGAQGATGLHFGISGGLALPRGDRGEFLDNGWHGQVLAVWNLPIVPVGLRADVLYARMDNDEQLTGERGGTDVFGGTANAVLGFQFPLVKPYVLGGIGRYRLESSHRSAHGSTEETDEANGWNAGAGVSISLRKINLIFEARYHNVAADGGDFEFVPVSIGLVF